MIDAMSLQEKFQEMLERLDLDEVKSDKDIDPESNLILMNYFLRLEVIHWHLSFWNYTEQKFTEIKEVLRSRDSREATRNGEELTSACR